MADLVFGLAKSAVEGTLTMVKSAIEEEEKLQKRAKSDLMLVSDQFEMIRSFLSVTSEHVGDDLARTCVRQVRNMALDVEDCIESVVHLNNKQPNWWRRLLPSCMSAAAPAAALDDAVASIELIKARIEAMGLRDMRYSRIGMSCFKPTNKDHQQAVANATASDILVEVRDAQKKKHSGPNDLVQLINKEDGGALRVISVWGTAGDLGTTSIIMQGYDDPGICQKFRCRAWVKLMHPFNPREFICSLLIQFYTSCSAHQGSTVDSLKLLEGIEAGLLKEFLKQVSNQRYLIILEDLSTMADWDTIKVYLPDNNNGSCVIVHTPQLEIASFCVGSSYQMSEQKRFSDDHSVCLFFKEDKEENAQTTKEKAARVWLDKFRRMRVGRGIGLNILHHMAIHADDIQVFAVWGIAGVGKSSMVKYVYCSEVIERSTFEKFGWVNVSHPLNLRDLLRSLLLDLQSESLHQCNRLRMKDPIQECRDLLYEYKCLVVIDGLQSTEEWDLIQAALVFEATGGPPNSRIIVITNELSVATHCSMTTWNVRGLEVDLSLDLFLKKTGSSDLNPAVLEQAKLILHKCGGLPKVIVAITDFLTRLNTSDGLEACTMLNDNFMQKLETDLAFRSLKGLFAWVHSYFLTCPDFLKPCVFYLSIFPANHNIQRRRLVRRWVAEGYSRDNKQSTAEEAAEEFFSMLVKLSMIRMQGSRILSSFIRMPLCQVNGFFLEYIISRPMENLIFALEGHCRINSQRTGRHLAIRSTWDRDRNVFESIDFSRLRSLTVFGEWRSFFISGRMRLLRVLDLEDASGVPEEDLEQMVKSLPRLKFLSLRGCSQVSRLPDSLGDLQQLQTLDIRDTSIIKLPKSIIKLQKLQFIRAGTTVTLDDDDTCTVKTLPTAAQSPSLSKSRPHTRMISWLSELCKRRQLPGSQTVCVEGPKGIGRLTALHTLGVMNVSMAAILKELKNLTQLHMLGVSGINRNNSHEFFSAISGHNHLELLSLYLDNDSQGCLDGISQPPQNLRSLRLYGLVGKLPVWIRQLEKLTRLNLQMNMLSQEDIDLLRDLPKLSILCLGLKKFQDGELRFCTALIQVHVLEITCNSTLEAVTFPTTGFSNLEAMKLHCSTVSHLKVFSLSYLNNLKEVWLTGSYDDSLKQYLWNQLAEHPNEIKPVLRQGPRWS